MSGPRHSRPRARGRSEARFWMALALVVGTYRLGHLPAAGQPCPVWRQLRSDGWLITHWQARSASLLSSRRWRRCSRGRTLRIRRNKRSADRRLSWCLELSGFRSGRAMRQSRSQRVSTSVFAPALGGTGQCGRGRAIALSWLLTLVNCAERARRRTRPAHHDADQGSAAARRECWIVVGVLGAASAVEPLAPSPISLGDIDCRGRAKPFALTRLRMRDGPDGQRHRDPERNVPRATILGTFVGLDLPAPTSRPVTAPPCRARCGQSRRAVRRPHRSAAGAVAACSCVVR